MFSMMAMIANRLYFRRVFRCKTVFSRYLCDNKKDIVDAADNGTLKKMFTAVHKPVVETDESALFEETGRPKTLQKIIPRKDPKETSIILFPGQGTQFVGMGTDVLDCPNVEQMFNVARHILGYDLLDICLNGPEDILNQTKYSQPAIFVCSLAAVEKLRTFSGDFITKCVATAGFSVGEFAALVFGGVLAFEDALNLVKVRAEGMQYVSEMIPSGMMTIVFGANAKVGLALKAATEWCIRQGIDEEQAVCSVCNYLFPHCKVIGGHEEALKFLEMNAKEFGIRRCTRLKVSGAFHTRLMEPAQKVFQQALRHVKISSSLIPIYSNYDGHLYKNEKDVVKKLGRQMCAPVRWEQILHHIYSRKGDENFPKTFECGPGKSLLSVLNKVNARASLEAKSIAV